MDYWTMKDGTKKHLTELTLPHLLNIREFLIRIIRENQEKLESVEQEIDRQVDFFDIVRQNIEDEQMVDYLLSKERNSQ